MDPHALGQLCLERELLTEVQLAAYLDMQRNGQEWRHLGQILLEHGVLTGVTFANLLALQTRVRGLAPGVPAAPRPPASERKATELDWLLSEARDRGALGLVLAAGRAPVCRLPDGAHVVQGPPLTETQMQRILAEAVPPSVVQRLEADGSTAATLELEGQGHVRAVLYAHRDGVAMSIKTTVAAPMDFAELGLPGGARDLLNLTSGLTLVTGPSGCGKSTTLASFAESINQTRPCHLLLIEDPLEMQLTTAKAQITRRQVGTNTPSIEAALRAAPGSDADVVFVAELETRGAIAAALDLAQSGRLVVAGMRTPGVQATVGRILDTFRYRKVPFANDALANCLRGILSQRLFGGSRGTSARVAAELLLPTPGVVNLIREGRIGQLETTMRTGGPDGLVSLEESLARLVRKGHIQLVDAEAAANDPDGLRRIIGLQGETVHAGS